MAVTIVVGGQFGSEGKGKVCAFLAERENPTIMVRCGGPNSGHTVIVEGTRIILRQLPVGAVLSDCRLLIPAGGYISIDVLMHEIEQHAIDKRRIGIDPNAVIITDGHIKDESYSKLQERIGSTLSGTGAAVVSRAGRKDNALRAENCQELKDFLTDVVAEVTEARESGENVLVEGTQGFGLSVYHTPHYPFATSRDTTAAGFASEVGISPLDVDKIVMVIRAFPIRVEGNSGPLKHETTWDEVTNKSGATDRIEEYTSVTKHLRRVADFDPEIVRRAILVNKPSEIILNHIDYIDWTIREAHHTSQLTPESLDFVVKVERSIDHSISFVGTGPSSDHMVYLKELDLEDSDGSNLHLKEVSNARSL